MDRRQFVIGALSLPLIGYVPKQEVVEEKTVEKLCHLVLETTSRGTVEIEWTETHDADSRARSIIRKHRGDIKLATFHTDNKLQWMYFSIPFKVLLNKEVIQ